MNNKYIKYCLFIAAETKVNLLRLLGNNGGLINGYTKDSIAIIDIPDDNALIVLAERADIAKAFAATVSVVFDDKESQIVANLGPA